VTTMVTFSEIGHRLAAANKPLPRDAKGELVEPTSKLQQLKHHIATPWFWGTCVRSVERVKLRRSVLMSSGAAPPWLTRRLSVWYSRWCIFVVIFIVMISLQLWLQWFWLLLYAALIIPFAPWQSIPMRFYR